MAYQSDLLPFNALAFWVEFVPEGDGHAHEQIYGRADHRGVEGACGARAGRPDVALVGRRAMSALRSLSVGKRTWLGLPILVAIDTNVTLNRVRVLPPTKPTRDVPGEIL